MATRFYVMDMIGTGTQDDPRRPKYAEEISAAGQGWSAMDFGIEPHCVLGCDDVMHTALTAHTDVQSMPLDLDQLLTAANVTTVQTILENRNMPSQWVTTSLTWRQMLKNVMAFFQFMQRLNYYHPDRLFQTGITLDSPFSALPLAVRQRMQQAAQSLGYDTSGLTASSTLRQILRTMAQEWKEKPIYLHGVTF